MKTRFRIIPGLSKKGCLIIHPDSAKQIGIKNKNKAFIQFGICSYETKIFTSYEVGVEEIILSNEILEGLKMPLTSKHEILLQDNKLIIGPFIGILATYTQERLEKMVETLSNYLYNYDYIGGTILAFSIEGIDSENKIINGYIFNPQTKHWEKGTYGYPTSVFKRIGTSKNWRNHFNSVIGDKIFNDYIFNKWEMFKWLNKSETIRKHIPDTIRYKKSRDIKWFLNLHEKMYIKPLYGSQGLGIIEVSKKGKRVLLKYNEQEKTKEKYFLSMHEARTFLKDVLQGTTYIIQQAVNLISYEQRLIDFRLLILKNEQGKWKDIGMIARYGKQDSIVSNISSGGTAELGEETLKKVLFLDDKATSKLRKKMSEIAIATAKSLESIGVHCGNLGIDLGIDTDGHIWIIEVNNKDPNHTIALDAGQRQMFYQSKLSSMLYAKKLAGF